MSEDADFPNADADPRGHQRLPRRAEFGGELSSSGLPGCPGPGVGAFSVFTGTAADLLGPSQLLPLFEAVICAGALP